MAEMMILQVHLGPSEGVDMRRIAYNRNVCKIGTGCGFVDLAQLGLIYQPNPAVIRACDGPGVPDDTDYKRGSHCQNFDISCCIT
jgi:hypothetical protein